MRYLRVGCLLVFWNLTSAQARRRVLHLRRFGAEQGPDILLIYDPIVREQLRNILGNVFRNTNFFGKRKKEMLWQWTTDRVGHVRGSLLS